MMIQIFNSNLGFALNSEEIIGIYPLRSKLPKLKPGYEFCMCCTMYNKITKIKGKNKKSQ